MATAASFICSQAMIPTHYHIDAWWNHSVGCCDPTKAEFAGTTQNRIVALRRLCPLQLSLASGQDRDLLYDHLALRASLQEKTDLLGLTVSGP